MAQFSHLRLDLDGGQISDRIALPANSMVEKKPDKQPGLAEAQPHYHGHRERLRERFRAAGAEALSDYELLEALMPDWQSRKQRLERILS